MREVNRAEIIEALEVAGVRGGDGLLVHSAIQFLGRPVDGEVTYLNALKAVLGPLGTIAVPTFNFAFATGEPYDPVETPSEGMGVFSEYVRQQPEARRTTHPMQSLAVVGYRADDIVSQDTPSAFDTGSSFELLLEFDFKILLLGAEINAVSLLHYSEQRVEVPYRYWKNFIGEVKTKTDWQARTYRMFVRDLDIDPRIDLKPVQALLQERDQWLSVPLNYGFISQCRALDFVAAVDHFLSTDPWSLVTNRPGVGIP